MRVKLHPMCSLLWLMVTLQVWFIIFFVIPHVALMCVFYCQISLIRIAVGNLRCQEGCSSRRLSQIFLLVKNLLAGRCYLALVSTDTYKLDCTHH